VYLNKSRRLILSIYRGAGGSGDAVNDASSEASLVQQLAIEAQADADAAQASATAAAGSASTASTQATNASNSATAASTSASNASTSATNAASSASAASTSASNASTSATNASNSATSASTSASTATTQAGIATTQASNASTSASNASSAQTAAEAARDATLTAYDNFDDRYLGSKTSDPTLDNDGNALLAGSLYFNSVSGAMKVYTGSAWVAAYVSGADYLAKANNLSDLTSAPTARTNLGLVIGTDVLSPSGSGASLTSLNATNLSSGTVAAARLPAFTGDATSTSGTSALTLATVNANTGAFGSTTTIPVITVNGKGLITAVSTAAVSGSISVTGGDLTLSGNTGTAITNATLATVNSTTGSFGSSSSIPVVTVNAKGLVTSVTTAAVAGGQYFGTAASKAIAYNEDSIAENITTTSGKNCLSVGPITIASSYSVTIASGQRWIIL
jgi:hypothetical protein